MKIKISYCENQNDFNAEHYNPYEIDFFLKVEDMLKSTGKYGAYQYSKNNKGINYRKEEFVNGYPNCIILDFDDGATIKEFVDKYRHEFVFALGTTRSHKIDKKTQKPNSIHRFRVIIPTTDITLEPKDLKDLNKHLLGKSNRNTGEVIIRGYFDGADEACTDLARVYRGYPKATTYVNMNTSKLFDWQNVWETVEQWRVIQRYKQEQKELREQSYERNGTKADWYRENWKTDVMFGALKVSSKWGNGSRNITLYSFGAYLKKDIGLSDEEVSDAVFWINQKSGDPLDEVEIKTTICKSLRLPF